MDQRPSLGLESSQVPDAERHYLTNLEQSKKNDKRVLDVLSKGLASEFPNPGRVGCPGAAVLEGIASHRIPLSEAEKWLEHLGSCSPCFQEFTALRDQRRRRRRRTWGGGLALLGVSLVLWFTLRPRQPGSETAMLDLLSYSGRRGEQSASGLAPLELQRHTKYIVLYLPIGSKEGNYDFALLNERGEELLHGSGRAQLENHMVVLRSEINPAGVPPGSYFLGLRQNDMEWTRFPVNIK